MTIRNRSSHIKFVHGQIKLIPIHIRLLSLSRPKPLINTLFKSHFMIWDARLILLVIVLLNFHFQKCRDPNPLLDPVGGSKLEPGLLRRFQSKHLFRFVKFSFSKVSRPESPTRPERRIRTGARFTPTFLIKRKHLFSGNPMTIYKFKTPITFTLNTCIYK